MVRLDDLQIFVRAAETGSFSAAARELDIAPAQASAALQRLERALGVRLFVRSTRRMRLSEDGERYCRMRAPRCRHLPAENRC